MPSIAGHVPEEHEEYVRQLMDRKGWSMSEALEYAIRYTAEHKENRML